MLACASSVCAGEQLMVSAKRKPSDKWKEYATTLVAQLEGFKLAAVKLDAYGGDTARKDEARGFFYAKKLGDRWWLVNPEGNLFLHVAVCSTTPGRGSDGAEQAFQKKYGTVEKWAEDTVALLKANAFNGTGSWSKDDTLAKAPARLAYAPIWNFMSSYGKQRGGTFQKPGHTGYPNDAIFVFDPEFEAFCMKHAGKLAATKDDPWLLGHFSDNEMPLSRKSLDKFLTLKPDDHGFRGAQEWLNKRKGKDATLKDATDADREAFVGHIVDRYCAAVAKAIKAHDPNHMYLGCRFHSDEKNIAAAFEAAGRHMDVVSVNLYGAWTPDAAQLTNWAKWAGKPFMITEFYAKGEDSGMANVTGAGWLVKTQEDRGRFYQNFCLGLLRSRGCVGWHHFKYQDNDPENLKTDPSNRDSNKGIITNRFEEYPPFLKLMRELNENVYGLADCFDKPGK
jgi:hypothetical protein